MNETDGVPYEKYAGQGPLLYMPQTLSFCAELFRAITINLASIVCLNKKLTTMDGPDDGQYPSRSPSLRVHTSVIDSPRLIGKYIQVRKSSEYCCFIWEMKSL